MSVFPFWNPTGPASHSVSSGAICGQNHLAQSPQSFVDSEHRATMAMDFHVCVSTYDTFSRMKHRPLGKKKKKMSGNNSYSLLHVSGHCADTWKRAKTGIGTHAFMPVLRLGCCALANFSEEGPFLVKRQRHGKNQIQPLARRVVGMQFIKRCHLISSVWGVQLSHNCYNQLLILTLRKRHYRNL